MKWLLTIILVFIPGCAGLSVTAGIGLQGFTIKVEREPMPFEKKVDAPAEAEPFPDGEAYDER